MSVFYEGKIVGTISVVRDVSERKKIEEDKKTREHLERTNRELEQFAYISSHDLQEPLRMVGSYAQLLSKKYSGKIDKEADDYIRYIVSGATRMHELINDLLAFSRLASPAIVFSAVNTEAALNAAVNNLQVSVEEAGAKILHDSLPRIRGNHSQIIQLFQNLIGNAIKFRSNKPLEIRISAKEQDNRWLFKVSDNGIGFDQRHSERIFVVFKRLHSREKYPGTGIGLATCKKIVERHGGRIWATSEPGQGSVFYFTLPNAEATASVSGRGLDHGPSFEAQS